jgi:hypothetical protein
MRTRFYTAILATVLLSSPSFSRAQTPSRLPNSEWQPVAPGTIFSGKQPGGNEPNPDQRLVQLTEDASKLQKLVGAQTGAAAEQQKQIELLQKQIETQQKMIQLLADQMKKQPGGGAATEKLEEQTTVLEARGLQAAQRDQELSQAVSELNERQDLVDRFGAQIPAQLKELFLPSGNNESPLSIYGALAVGFTKIQGTPGGFYFGEFSPDFLLKLNDWILLEAEIAIGSDGTVAAGSFAQMDFFVNDWLTIVAGRFVAPIGWYNERLNNPWINKMPADAPGASPLLWMQVLPPTSLLGVQARGSFYLPSTPVKMEYAAYVSNGFNVTPATAGAPTFDEVANLENMENTFNITSTSKMVGGRLGLWWPEVGLAGGVSGMYNGSYMQGFNDSMSLWAVDLNYRKGNWDIRAEYGVNFQQAFDLIGTNIRREGMYTQVAYRPRDASNKYLQNIEFIYRYSYVNFSGIDPTLINPANYATPIDTPVLHQQHEFGVDYWFTPRLVAKAAYEINTQPGLDTVHNNNFMVELAWGW